MSDKTNPTTVVLHIDKPRDVAHLWADPARQAADEAARAAERRYAALAGAKAAEMLTQLLPTAHKVLVEVTEDEDNRTTLDLLTVRAADGALLLFTGDFEEIPDAVALLDAAESGGKPVPSFDRDTQQAIESLLFEVVEWGRSAVLKQVTEDIPVPFQYKASLRDGRLWEMTLPDVTAEATKAHPHVMSEGGRLFPVSYESQNADERDGVVTYWLPLVDEHGRSTFLDVQCWAGREAEASDLAVRTMWRFPDGSTWCGPALPSDTDAAPQDSDTGGERPSRRYTDHSNQLGDWCPWSGKPAPALSEAGDPCPAVCPASGTEEVDEPDDEPSGETATCKFCKSQVPAATAHRHDGGFVGDCCWDERLRATA